MPTEVELPFSRLIVWSIIFFKAAFRPRRGKIQARQVLVFFFFPGFISLLQFKGELSLF